MSNKNLHNYYNETYYKEDSIDTITSVPESNLALLVKHMLQLNVVYDGSNTTLGDVWDFKFYEGGQLSNYVNESTASKSIHLFDFNKISLVSEIQKHNVGIRFFASLVEEEASIETVVYLKGTDPSDPAKIEKRYFGKINEIITAASLSRILSEAQKLYTSEDAITNMVYH